MSAAFALLGDAPANSPLRSFGERLGGEAMAQRALRPTGPAPQLQADDYKPGDRFKVEFVVVRKPPWGDGDVCAGHIAAHPVRRNGQEVDTLHGIRPDCVIGHIRPALKVGDKVRDPLGDVLEIVATKRAFPGRGQGWAEYGVWTPVVGYDSRRADLLETWERVGK